MNSMLSCPRCQQTLFPRSVVVDSRTVLVEICTRGCGGVWLDDGDVRSGLDISDDLLEVCPETPPTPGVDLSKSLDCPVCETTMERYRWNYQSPVALDQCAGGCGTWVDGGEVQQMETWETATALSEPKRAQILSRVHIARLEVETALVPTHTPGITHPVVIALQNLYHKLV